MILHTQTAPVATTFNIPLATMQFDIRRSISILIISHEVSVCEYEWTSAWAFLTIYYQKAYLHNVSMIWKEVVAASASKNDRNSHLFNFKCWNLQLVRNGIICRSWFSVDRSFIVARFCVCMWSNELGIGNHSFPMHELPPYFFNVNNSGIIWFLHFKYMWKTKKEIHIVLVWMAYNEVAVFRRSTISRTHTHTHKPYIILMHLASLFHRVYAIYSAVQAMFLGAHPNYIHEYNLLDIRNI